MRRAPFPVLAFLLVLSCCAAGSPEAAWDLGAEWGHTDGYAAAQVACGRRDPSAPDSGAAARAGIYPGYEEAFWTGYRTWRAEGHARGEAACEGRTVRPRPPNERQRAAAITREWEAINRRNSGRDQARLAWLRAWEGGPSASSQRFSNDEIVRIVRDAREQEERRRLENRVRMLEEGQRR